MNAVRAYGASSEVKSFAELVSEKLTSI